MSARDIAIVEFSWPCICLPVLWPAGRIAWRTAWHVRAGQWTSPLLLRWLHTLFHKSNFAERTRVRTLWPTPYHWKCRGVTILTPFVDFWQQSLYRARIVFICGTTAISKKWVPLHHFCTYRPEILYTPRERQFTKSCWGEFWNSSPEKFGTPLNFALALRPMGWKFQISFTRVSEVVLVWYFHTH